MGGLPDWAHGLRLTTDVLYIVDHNRTIVLWNRGAERLFGRSEAEVLGRACNEVIDGTGPDGRPWCGRTCAIQRALARRTPHDSFDLRIRDRANRIRNASLSIILIPTQDRLLAVHVMRVTDRVAHDSSVLEAIQSLLETSGYPPPNGARTIGESGDSPYGLTRREREILSRVAEGTPTATIAETLCISPYTVRNHIQAVLGKLEVHSRSEAVALAYKNGLV